MADDSSRMFPGRANTDRRADRQRLNAALIDAAGTIRAARDAGNADAAVLARCDALLQSARDAADADATLVARSCLHQIERELAATMDEAQRGAALAAYRSEAAAAGVAREAIDALARDRDATAVDLQALMRVVHAARERRYERTALARRQAAVLAALLVAAVLFFSGWALAGGFEWILHEDVEVTLAMMLVNGVLFGFLGGLLSTVFALLPAQPAPEASGSWAATLARPFIGAAVAIPIAFFLQSGLLNLGNVTPAIDLALCFLGGFSERLFVRRLRRAD